MRRLILLSKVFILTHLNIYSSEDNDYSITKIGWEASNTMTGVYLIISIEDIYEHVFKKNFRAAEGNARIHSWPWVGNVFVGDILDTRPAACHPTSATVQIEIPKRKCG